MKELDLIENQDIREKMIGNVSVLEKVKDLLLLGNSDFATTQQVADYYEVDITVIQKLVSRNKQELESNGLKLTSKNDIKNLIGHNDKLEIPNRGMKLFSKRAILNVGMLLTGSPIADKIKQELGLYSSWNLHKRKEIEFLNKLEESLKPFNITGIRQFPIDINYKHYRIDYYIPQLNIAVEYDENGHTSYTYEEHEGRQKEIEKELGCKFIRVTDNNSDEYNIGLVIKELFNITVVS